MNLVSLRRVQELVPLKVVWHNLISVTTPKIFQKGLYQTRRRRGGGINYNLAISTKLHENEINWTQKQSVPVTQLNPLKLGRIFTQLDKCKKTKFAEYSIVPMLFFHYTVHHMLFPLLLITIPVTRFRVPQSYSMSTRRCLLFRLQR